MNRGSSASTDAAPPPGGLGRPDQDIHCFAKGASHPRWLEDKHALAPIPIVRLVQRPPQTVGFERAARSAEGLSKCAKKLRALYGHGPGRNSERRYRCRGELLSARRALFEVDVSGRRNGV